MNISEFSMKNGFNAQLIDKKICSSDWLGKILDDCSIYKLLIFNLKFCMANYTYMHEILMLVGFRAGNV